MGIFETTNQQTSRGKTSILIHLIMGKIRQQYLVNEVFKADIRDFRVRCLSISQRSMNTCAQFKDYYFLITRGKPEDQHSAKHREIRGKTECQVTKPNCLKVFTDRIIFTWVFKYRHRKYTLTTAQ